MFAKNSERGQRARALEKIYSAKGVADGMVFLLRGTPEVMDIRTHQRHKQGSVEYIAGLQRAFEELWGVNDGVGPAGVVVIDTVDRTVGQVVKEISKHVHLGPFTAVGLPSLLTQFGKK